ncbi:MAG: hypothetical protein II874_04195 [Bacteroidales bacterium]|nr:hypothetical protein [Bacteroidales bacterium]
MEDYRRLSTRELEKLLQMKMDEIYIIRQELDRRKNGPPRREGSENIDFTKYLTD